MQFVTPEIALKELLHGEVTDHSSSVQQEVAMGDDENKVSGRNISICTRLKVMEVRTKTVYFLEEELRRAVSQAARPWGLGGTLVLSWKRFQLQESPTMLLLQS